jgi:hypothetical protein
MAKLQLIIADNLKIEFCKVKKDYIVGLAGKSLINRKSLGSKPPKVGLKAAECKDGKLITIYEYTGTKQGWVKLLNFTPTSVDVYHTKIYYKSQKYFHKDIIKDKSKCELFFDDKTSHVCSPSEALSFIFEAKVLPTPKQVKKDLLNTADELLSCEEIWKNQQLEISMGICPF